MPATGTIKTRKRRVHPLNEGARPAWEVAYLFPAQGDWTEEDYLALESCEGVFPLAEMSRGRIEVLPMPTQPHQFIVLMFLEMLKAFATQIAPGVVLPTGMRVRLGPRLFRYPDVVYMRKENSKRRNKKYWDGADLVMEVVSEDPKDRRRDLETKRRDYARGGVPEYWIFDPELRTVTVLTLKDGVYEEAGVYITGETAKSRLLPGFEVSIDAIFSAAMEENQDSDEA